MSAARAIYTRATMRWLGATSLLAVALQAGATRAQTAAPERDGGRQAAPGDRPRLPSQLEPWSDPDPSEPRVRHPLGDSFGLRIGAEYRAQLTTITPLALNDATDPDASWIEHRLRFDAAGDYRDKVRIVGSLDVFDGVLWGDNGTFGKEPEPNSGANVTTRNPNAARSCVAPREGGDPLESDGYGLTLCPVDVVRVRKLYGEVVTPVGLLRVGRQPTTVGTGVVVADGDGRTNRWGIAHGGNVVDRVLFATKPLEVKRPAQLRDTSDWRGLFFVAAYDRLVTDEPRIGGDDLHQVATSVRLLLPGWAPRRDFELAVYDAYRWDEAFETQVDVLGWRALARLGDFRIGAEAVMNIGSTREVSTAYALVNNDPVTPQRVRQWGARAVARYDRPAWTAYLEVDYASGDDDPEPGSALTQFYFPEDANVGLLLFEHVLAYQSARAAAAGTELLRRLGSKTFPADVVSSRGAFTNAIALFPQVDLKPLPDLLFRGGVLVAWAQVPVVDPVGSLRRKDGRSIADDLVNLNGGTPGSFYGTEIDGRISWRLHDHFAADLEGALLFPGDAFWDENEQAVRSGMVQARTTFWF